MLTRILATGLLAGVLAGLLVSGLLQVTTTPLILKAETYEKAGEKTAGHRHTLHLDGEARLILAHAETHEAANAAAAGEPADGFERTAYTMLATVGTAVGFSLMLLAAMLASGVVITPRSGVLWGLGAFVATALAPALGLPPGLPGSAAADLVPRQLWWIATATATAGGIWLMFRTKAPWATVAGITLIVLPHIVGAPHPHELTSAVPAEIAGHFAAASLVVHSVLWALIGAFAGAIWQRGIPAGSASAA